MSQRIALFDEIKTGGYEACLVTSFNIDFPFYEDVLLRRMQTQGIQHHVMLVDQAMCQQAMATHPPVKAGHHYTLAPMSCPGAFHPKVMMLLGQKKGLLAVGSHNLTLSGFGQNLEVSNVVRYSASYPGYLPLFQTAFQAFRDWLHDYGERLPDDIGEAIEQTLNLCPWLEASKPAVLSGSALLYSSKSCRSLWAQAKPHLPERVDEVTALAPFFDSRLTFLGELSAISRTPPLIGIQPDRVSAPVHLLEDERFRVVSLDHFPETEQGHGYTHAKLVAMRDGKRHYLLSGSANLTWPAWLEEGAHRNAEAVLMLSGEPAAAAFQALSVDQLRRASTATTITQPFVQPDSMTAEHTASVLVLPYPASEWLQLPIQTEGKAIKVFYRQPLGARVLAEIDESEGLLRVAVAYLKVGDVLIVELDEQPVAYVVIHCTHELRAHTLTGEQQRLKLALGSLQTESPEIPLLFDCIEKLMNEKGDVNAKLPAVHYRASAEQLPNAETVSLIVEQEDVQLAEHRRCQRLAVKGNLALLLDVLIYSFSAASLGDNSAAYGEDALGRNEEERIGSDDELVTAHSQVHSTEDECQQRVAYCQRQCRILVGRLDRSLGSLNIQADLQPEFCARTLAISAVLRLLHTYKICPEQTENCVSDDVLSKLMGMLFRHAFHESQIPVENSQDDKHITASAEFIKLLAHAVWLTYVSGLCFSAPLPLSAPKEERDSVNWHNAILLFLAQRLDASDKLSTEVGRLLADYGDKASAWLIRLLNAGKEIRTSNQVTELGDVRLATSHYHGFWGYRQVVGEEGEYLTLSSIDGVAGKKFKRSFLNENNGRLYG